MNRKKKNSPRAHTMLDASFGPVFLTSYPCRLMAVVVSGGVVLFVVVVVVVVVVVRC